MHEMFAFEAEAPLHVFDYALPKERKEQHWHSFYEFGYCLEGDGIFYVGEDAIPLGPGDLLFFPPYELHIARSGTDGACRCVFVYFGETLFQEEDRPLLRALRRAFVLGGAELRERVAGLPPLHELFRKMREEFDARQTGHAALLRAWLLELCVRLHRAEEKRHSPANWRGRLHALTQIKPALDYVEARFREPMELDDLARLLALSASRTRHLFKLSVGRRFKEHLTFVRIREAKRLLATTGMSVTDVYLACGFQSSAPFYRSFQQLVGISPTDYRRTREQLSQLWRG